ncbi:ADP-ribosyl cyclase/cyclic ADP-ribose hydrolase 1-like [Xyrichtys novacula]|uniref:ADP-ribosyl cyclase/cyclic ADP-ribose hydrolase n=1 Tax=Xyrichtys novacula TaxID=13765 RepID=A0AAV1H9T9_XYRNO|nr:ADP-ribosyl cyclase/cyclic ADP-ribose hydrolase 1-like [Xyrichtys novacula]
MEPVERFPPQKRRTKRCLFLTVVAVLLLIVILGIALGVGLYRSSETFKTTFMNRCEKFEGSDCEKIWTAFEQAYLGKDPCEVPMEAYDPLIAAAPFEPACNRMMFWSKTKDVAHEFTAKKHCFTTLEDTLLGSVLNDLTWCGKEGSGETFTSGCPRWNDCDNNTVRSFWNRVSAAVSNQQERSTSVRSISVWGSNCGQNNKLGAGGEADLSRADDGEEKRKLARPGPPSMRLCAGLHGGTLCSSLLSEQGRPTH